MTLPDPSTGFLQALNSASPEAAARMLDPILERSAWLAQRIARARPFESLAALADEIETRIIALSAEDRLRLLRAHPELAPPEPALMTAASQHEQGRLALDRADTDVSGRLRRLNAQYMARHGFPFIIALHAAANIDTVLAQFTASLDLDTDAEMARALGAVSSVARARLNRHAAAQPASAPQAGTP